MHKGVLNMKISIQKQVLQEAIFNVQKAISGKVIMPILQGILIIAENSQITLIGSNMDLIIETKIQGNILEEGKVVVDSRFFGDIIRKLPDATIQLESKDNKTITIEYSSSTAILLHMDANEYPSLPDIKKETTFQISQRLIKNMIKGTIFAIAQDEFRATYTGVLFEVSSGNLNLVSLDGYRAAIRSEKIESSLVVNKIIPGKTLNEVYKILEDNDNLIDISFASNHVIFSLGNTKISSRLLEGNFVKHEDIIPKEYSTKIIVKRNDLLNSIERASLMGKEEYGSKVILEIQDDNIFIIANSQFGKLREKINIVLQGNNLKIAFNSKYLLDVLKVIDNDEIVLELNNSVNPCIIKNKNSDNCVYMLVPILHRFGTL
jgi:DNA polymerase-3 subunit beta